MFSEILTLLSRSEIKKVVQKHNGDRYRKSFKTWDHLVAMLTAQFGSLTSLRELEVALNSHTHHHYHLNCSKVKRSTLSDANKGRSFEIFRDIAMGLLCRLRNKKQELKQVITIFDSTLIQLNGRGNAWSQSSRTRLNNQGLKVHIEYNQAEESIEYAEVSATTINDINVAQQVRLKENRIYVFDKGYCDYNWWRSVSDHQSLFVTRLKKNAAYTVVETRNISEEDKHFILKDEIIKLSNKHPRGNKKNRLAECELRVIQIQHPSKKEAPFMIVSNALDCSAQQVAGWYKKRWSIELLFKWLKQNLKLKKFIGENRNAIMIQIYVALIAYILLKLYSRLRKENGWRLKDINTLIRTTLFARPQIQDRRRERRCLLEQYSRQLSLGFCSC